MAFERMRIESQASTSTRVGTSKSVMVPVELTRTEQPVWPEDEAHERHERRAEGLGPVPDLSEDEADGALRSVRVALPDVVLPQPTDDATAFGLPGSLAGLTPLLLAIPLSFDAPASMSLRRVRLSLAIQAPEVGVFLLLAPCSSVASRTQHVAEVGVDLGKLVSALFPSIPDAFTAKVQTGVDVTTVRPVVQASGELTRVCSWRISDSEMAYGFRPSAVVGTHGTEGLTVTAELHVEVRKRVLGVFHKTYGKSATPRRYVMEPGPNGLVPREWARRARTPEGPGVISLGELRRDLAEAQHGMSPGQLRHREEHLAGDLSDAFKKGLKETSFDPEQWSRQESDETSAP